MSEKKSKCENCGGEADGLYLCPACSMNIEYVEGDEVWDREQIGEVEDYGL